MEDDFALRYVVNSRAGVNSRAELVTLAPARGLTGNYTCFRIINENLHLCFSLIFLEHCHFLYKSQMSK